MSQSVPASSAGKGKPSDMMSCHERRLMHDVIELRNEQITIKKLLDSMQSDITKLSDARNAATMARPNKNIGFDDPANAEQPVSSWRTALISQTDDATEAFPEMFGKAFEQIEGRLNDEITRLKGQLNSMQSSRVTDSGSQLPLDNVEAPLDLLREETQVWRLQHERELAANCAAVTDCCRLVASFRDSVAEINNKLLVVDNVEALCEHASGLTTFREEVMAWKMQTDLKVDRISLNLEKVTKELPLLVLKTCIGGKQRALEVVELKETSIEQQFGGRPALQPGQNPAKPSSRQALGFGFKNGILDDGTGNPSAVDEFGADRRLVMNL